MMASCNNKPLYMPFCGKYRPRAPGNFCANCKNLNSYKPVTNGYTLVSIEYCSENCIINMQGYLVKRLYTGIFTRYTIIHAMNIFGCSNKPFRQVKNGPRKSRRPPENNRVLRIKVSTVFCYHFVKGIRGQFLITSISTLVEIPATEPPLVYCQMSQSLVG